MRTRGEALSSPHTVESGCPFPSGPAAGPPSPMAAAAPRDPAQVNARPPGPPRRSSTQTRKARARGACSRPCGPGPGVRDREAPAGGGPCVSAGVLAAGAGSGLRGRLGQRLEAVCAPSGEQHVSLPCVSSKVRRGQRGLSPRCLSSPCVMAVTRGGLSQVSIGFPRPQRREPAAGVSEEAGSAGGGSCSGRWYCPRTAALCTLDAGELVDYWSTF